MSGSHYAPPPAPDARYSESTCYDLTPPDALHPLTDIAALRLEVAALADALNYAHRRIDEQARALAALRTAVVQHADALTVLNLRSGA